MTRLRRAAVDGVVSDEVFTAHVRSLGLGGAERERLRGELAKVGIPVQKSVVHTDVDSPDVKMVAPRREENVPTRLTPVVTLLERYADAEGYVTSRALEGVVRLAGLTMREAAALRAAAKLRTEPAVPETSAEASTEAESRDAESREAGAPETQEPDAKELVAEEPAAEDRPDGPADDVLEPSAVGVPTGAGLAAAIAAARAVMREDRHRRRPEKRLLTAQEEVGLSVLLRGGSAESMGAEPDDATLSALPPDHLRIRARDCLVLHNQGLVHSMVPKYLEQGLDYEDLFQHGALGLMRAARKFDPSRGFKFSTYATWWLRQSISRAIADEGSLIRVPVHMHEQIRKVAMTERSLAAQGRPATAADVAVVCDMSLKKVEEARRLSRRTDSLDRVVGDGVTLGEFVARTRVLPSVEAQVVNTLLARDVMAVVDTFTGRDHRILVRRLGLDGDDPSTLDELGREFGVTRERIRQLEVKLRPELQERLRKARRLGLRAVLPQEETGGAEIAPRAAQASGPARRFVAVRGRIVSGEGRQPERATVMPAARPSAAPPSGDAETAIRAIPRVWEPVNPGATGNTPDWDRARRLAKAPSGQAWLAEYVLAGLGHQGLAVLLGRVVADAVLRIARQREPADFTVLTALEVLRRVLDTVARAGLAPEDFLDRPAEALCGMTPRSYLADEHLVDGAQRQGAVRDALREFVAATSPGPEPVREEEQTEEADALVTDGEVPLADSATEAADEASGTEDAADAIGTGDASQCAADWDKALRLAEPHLGADVPWLAEYAVLAVGQDELAVLLGPPAADAVVRAARRRGMLHRHTVRALEVLQGVFDTLKGLGLRPEHFFHRPSEALVGVSPRAYLAERPLVGSESRLAVRDALREFVQAERARNESAPDSSDLSASEETPVEADERSAPRVAQADPQPVASAEEALGQPHPPQPPADVDRLLCEIRAQHAAELVRLTQEHERRLAEERRAADARVSAARAEAEEQLDALEEALLNRADRALARRERHLQSQAEARLARLAEEHREALLAVTRRAEGTEESASRAAENVFRWRARAEEAEQRLRQHHEESQARVVALDARLRQADARLAARDRAMYEAGQRAAARVEEAERRAHDAVQRATAAEQRIAAAEHRAAALVSAAEQRAAARIAQVEHDAWARITELQQQLAALQSPDAGRASLRDRWRRS